jgi:hypothetical protein
MEVKLFEFVTNKFTVEHNPKECALDGISNEKIKKKGIQIILQILENNHPISSLLNWIHENASKIPDFSLLDSLFCSLFDLQIGNEKNFRLDIFKFLKNVILEHSFKPFIHWSISIMNDLIIQLFERKEQREESFMEVFHDVFHYLKEFNHFTFSLDLLFTIAEYSLHFDEKNKIQFKDFFLKSTKMKTTSLKSFHQKNVEILEIQKFYTEKLTLESLESNLREILNYFNHKKDELSTLVLNEQLNLILRNESMRMSEFLSLIWRLKVDDEMISLFHFYLDKSSLEFMESLFYLKINFIGGVLLFLFKLISHSFVYSPENYQFLIESFYYFLNVELFSDSSKKFHFSIQKRNNPQNSVFVTFVYFLFCEEKKVQSSNVFKIIF